MTWSCSAWAGKSRIQAVSPGGSPSPGHSRHFLHSLCPAGTLCQPRHGSWGIPGPCKTPSPHTLQNLNVVNCKTAFLQKLGLAMSFLATDLCTYQSLRKCNQQSSLCVKKKKMDLPYKTMHKHFRVILVKIENQT